MRYWRNGRTAAFSTAHSLLLCKKCDRLTSTILPIGVPMRQHVLLLGYLTIMAFLLAHLINTLVAEALTDLPTALSAPRRMVPPASILSANRAKLAEDILADTLFALSQPELAAQGIAAPGGSLPLTGGAMLEAAKKVKLMGTVLTEGGVPLAVLEDIPTKRQTLYHLFENIPGIGAIVEIRADAILLQQGNLRERLELSMEQPVPAGSTKPPTAASQASAHTLKRVLDQRDVARSMADLPKLLSEAHAEPLYANGKVDGWKIDGLTPKGFYDRIGLKTGDILQRVNGVEIRDPGMMLNLFQQLKDERAVSLDLLRDGKKATMFFEIR
ncbi:MAG: hypothetical protein KGN30_08800 [Nitrospirota bacterium]|nr:hypothetical protein [Nitrospirota bacterium]MDE3225493.1 hypothetical protein [Nitrospirota bacterium]